MKPIISVIVPIYNAESYLEECIASIKEQSFTNFEVILVNDGSTDYSLDVSQKAIGGDKRFSLYDIPNGGVSHARNFALQKANADWITFIDADDWVSKDLLQTLVSYVDENVDIVMGNFYFNQRTQETRGICSREIIHKKEFPSYPLAMMVEDCASKDGLTVSVEILCAACCKLSRKSMLDKYGVKFDEELKLNEDGLFHLTSYLYARDVVIIGKPLYHYRIHTSSSNNKYRPDIHEQMKIWQNKFEKISGVLPNNIREDFLSLCAYRRYLNLSTLYINNPQNKKPILEKVNEMRSLLGSQVYMVSHIDKSLKFFKKIEMLFLKYHLSIALIAMAKIKYLIKYRKW